MEQKHQEEPSVSKTYKIVWAPSLGVLLRALEAKVPVFKVEIMDPEKPVGKKWFVSVYPQKESAQRFENKLIFKGHCCDSAYHSVLWGWLVLEPTEGEKGEIHF